jgi:predicted transposase YdaD
MGVELGLWEGTYQNQTQLWLRWWDEQGNLLLIEDERVQLERQRAESAEQALKNAIPRLLAMNLSIEQVAEALAISVEEVTRVIGNN